MSLFTGTPLSAFSSTTSSTETPVWMQEAIYNQIGNATNIANTPYKAYPEETVAGLSELQKQAHSQVQASQGQWAPAMTAAMQGTLGLASAPGGYSAAQPYAQKAEALDGTALAKYYMDNGLQQNGYNAAQPALNQQQGLLSSLNYNAPVDSLNPYVQQSISQGGLQAAQPYLNQSAQSSAGGIQDFMNPYQQQVMDTMATQAGRNLSENLLPAVSDAFVKAGQFGGSRMGEFGSRAVRDTQEALLQQQGQLANQGFTQAMGAAQGEQARQAQLAATAGGLGSSQQQAVLQGGQALSSSQQQAIQAAQAGASQYGQMGSTLGGLTQAQQAAMMQAGQNLGTMTQSQQQLLASLGQQAGSLAQNDIQNQQSALAQMANMAQQGQSLGMNDAAALESAGMSQQANQQALLNSYQNAWQQEQLYPRQQMDWLSTQIRGMAPITPQINTVNQSSTGNSYSASPLSQLASGMAAGAGLYNTVTR